MRQRLGRHDILSDIPFTIVAIRILSTGSATLLGNVKARRTMLGLHWPELVVIFGILVLIFGASRLPQIGSSIGKTIKEFQKSMREVTPEDNNAPPIAPPAADTEARQPAEPPRP